MAFKMQMPAGRYWVGDPLSVIADGFSWQHSTAYGDGIYVDNRGREYQVDSGCIGIFPTAEISEEGHGGHFITQRKPFCPTYKDGKFTFGTVVIDTNWEGLTPEIQEIYDNEAK
jgi:hypothetical protein